VELSCVKTGIIHQGVDEFGRDTFEYPEPMEWIMPMTTYNRKEDFISLCRGTNRRIARGSANCDICRIERIGKGGRQVGVSDSCADKKKPYKSWFGR
jgi:hypothetical protein